MSSHLSDGGAVTEVWDAPVRTEHWRRDLDSKTHVRRAGLRLTFLWLDLDAPLGC
jgi:hypothetical protein